jgi:predicted ATP-binding protein involved in virulence
LHIKLQKGIIPVLFNLFPDVQFILSSRSPFLNLGLAEVAKERTKIINLNNFCVSADPTANELYDELCKMMISKNDRFKEVYNFLNNTTKTLS